MKALIKKAFASSIGGNNGQTLTQAIVNTISEPLVVLDEDLRVSSVSRSFYKKFNLTKVATIGKTFYNLGNKEWDTPELRRLLSEIIPRHSVVKEYEMIYNASSSNPRTMLINACEIKFDDRGKKNKKILLSIFDITNQRALEAERENLLIQKDVLMKEMRHRIANSLQIIASILLLKAETVDSKESRSHLEDAHKRILSIATLQRKLDAVGIGEHIKVAPYLNALCKSLAKSMIGGRREITIEVKASHTDLVPSDTAVSFGLITTELIINSLKHAFHYRKNGKIIVTYESKKSGWTLSIGDNGTGLVKLKKGRSGLGTSIIGALANQLQAIIRTESSSKGTIISIIHSAVS